jgi:hypothetical protein
MLINQNFGSVVAVLGAFPKERDVVGRERSGRAYTMLSYFIAKVRERKRRRGQKGRRRIIF